MRNACEAVGVYSPSLPEKEVIFQSSVGNSPISNIGFLFFTTITTDKTRIKEKNNVIPINWAGNSGTVEDEEAVGVGVGVEVGDLVGTGVG